MSATRTAMEPRAGHGTIQGAWWEAAHRIPLCEDCHAARLAYQRAKAGTGITTYRRDEMFAELDLLEGETPENVALRLGRTPGAIGRALARAGRGHEARPYFAADRRRQRAATA